MPTSADDVFIINGYHTISIDNSSSQNAGTLTNYEVLDVSSGSLNVAGDVFNVTTFTSSTAAILAHNIGSSITLNSLGGSLTNSGELGGNARGVHGGISFEAAGG